MRAPISTGSYLISSSSSETTFAGLTKCHIWFHCRHKVTCQVPLEYTDTSIVTKKGSSSKQSSNSFVSTLMVFCTFVLSGLSDLQSSCWSGSSGMMWCISSSSNYIDQPPSLQSLYKHYWSFLFLTVLLQCFCLSLLLLCIWIAL